jgi:transposase
MASTVALREDFTAARMRALARSSRDANQVRRLLALARIYEGGTRSEAAQLGGVGLQTVRDWVLRFNAAGPDGLIDAVPPGGVSLLDDAQRRALAQIIESGPIPTSRIMWMRWFNSRLAALSCACARSAVSAAILAFTLSAMSWKRRSPPSGINRLPHSLRQRRRAPPKRYGLIRPAAMPIGAVRLAQAPAAACAMHPAHRSTFDGGRGARLARPSCRSAARGTSQVGQSHRQLEG